ncbi:MAG: hypothetical protein ACK5OB_17400, partial [Pirellula sp.]
LVAPNVSLRAVTGFIGASNQDRTANDADLSAIDTTVAKLEASAKQGFFVQNSAKLIVGQADPIVVTRVEFGTDGSSVTQNPTPGIRAEGPIKILVTNEDLVLERDVNASTADAAPTYFDVSLKAFQGAIEQGDASRLVGDELTLKAKSLAHIHDASVSKLYAETESNEKLNSWEQVNEQASQRGDDFLSNLEVKIPGLIIPDSIKKIYRFAEHYADEGYSLYVVNDRALDVQVVKAGAGVSVNSPNVYVETVGANNINVLGAVQTRSANTDEGGIILVAGSKLVLGSGGRLETFQSGGAAFDQTVLNQALDTRFFHLLPIPEVTLSGLPGIVNNSGFANATGTFFTTVSLLTQEQSAFVTDDVFSAGGPMHVNMQVASQFGVLGEKGFENFMGYADKLFGISHAANGSLVGTTPLRSSINNLVYASNTVLPAVLIDTIHTGLLVRQNPFSSEFIRGDVDGTLENFVVVRRANDFFLFQEAGAASGIEDLTNVTQQINVQRSAPPSWAAPTPPPSVPTFVAVVEKMETKTEQTLVVINMTTLESRMAADRQAEILLYRVPFVDENENGEPDNDELPTPAEVLEKVEGNQATAVDFPKDQKGSTTPTQAELNRVKDALARDPELPVGVYSIIKKNPDGGQEVLDIFPVRDSDPQTVTDPEMNPGDEKEEVEPIPSTSGGLPPQGNINDGAAFVPARFLREQSEVYLAASQSEHREDTRTNPTVALAIMLGAIGMRSGRSNAPSEQNDAPEESNPFARDARQQRSRASLLNLWGQFRRG